MGFRQYCMLWLLPLLWARADEAPGRCLVQDLSWERVAPEDLLVPAHCEGVDLSWTKIGDRRIRELSKELAIGCDEHNCLLPISYLDLSRTNMGDRGLRAVGELMRRNPPIEELRLDSNFISNEGVRIFFSELQTNTNLRIIKLAANHIDDRAMIAEVTPDGMTRQEAREADPTLMAGLSLSDVLSENCCLADIDLSWNKVGDKGARSLLRVVSAQNIITRLRLVGNQHKKNSKNGGIKDTTKAAIEEALRANQLRNKRIQERREAGAPMGIPLPFGGEDAAKARERAEREADRAGVLSAFRWEVPLEPGPEL